MQPLHKGLSNVNLYNSSKLKSVTVCLDSGLLATDACKADIRTEDLSRVANSVVYTEDYPEEYCEQHVMMEYCSGGGVANEYCKLFAEVDSSVKISETALLKLTETQVGDLKRASKYGLQKQYLQDDYVYYTDDDGEDAQWLGFYNKIKQDVEAPYIVCPKHDQKAWDKYQQSLIPPETEPPVDITEPTDPNTGLDFIWGA